METCKNCYGDGLVGNGPTPHLKEGAISKCIFCSGTGKVVVTTESSSVEVDSTIEMLKKNEESERSLEK